MELNWADWAVLVVVLISGLMSLSRGFVKELLSLVTWVGAFIVARSFSGNMETLLVDQIESPMVRPVAAFAILFFGTLIVGAGVNFLIGTLVKMTGLTTTDRLLGVAFGLVRGLVLLVVAVAFLRITPLSGTEWWKASIMIEQLGMLEQWSRSLFTEDVSTLIDKVSP